MIITSTGKRINHKLKEALDLASVSTQPPLELGCICQRVQHVRKRATKSGWYTYLNSGGLFLVARIAGLGWGGGGRRIGDLFPACAFYVILGTLIPLFTPGPRWLSKLRWLWLSVPWRVACEPVHLIDSHMKLGQLWQPTPTSLGQGCTCLGV